MFDFQKIFKRVFSADFIKNIKMNPNTILIAVAVVGIVIAAGAMFVKADYKLNIPFLGQSKEKIAQKAVDYINNNGLTTSEVSLVSVSEESGLVKIKIKVGTSEFDSYVTKDGKLLFPEAINIGGAEANNENQNADNTSATCDTVAKTDNTALDAYVVSQCPYGLQMQRAMADAVANAPALAQYIKVRYMGAVSGNTITSMHGEEEATENLRQICIREELPAKYWNYISCYIKAGNSTGCLASSGISSSTVSACMADINRGVAYAKQDFDLNSQYNIEGSPTLVLNGSKISESNFGGRSSDAVKQIVCCSSNSEPSFCSTELNTTAAASSFSETYSDSGSSSSTANCE